MDEIDFYSQKLLAIAAQLQGGERIASPDVSARKASRVCGSVVEVDLKIEEGRVVEFSQEVSACALGQTSAAIVAKNIIGRSEEEMRLVHAQMHAMLKVDGPPPDGVWSELAVLETVKDFTPRHKSIMLVFEAVLDGFDQFNAKEGQSA